MKEFKKYKVRVYTYDPYFEDNNNPSGRVADFEKEFNSYEEAVEFAKKFMDAEILRPYHVVAYHQGVLQLNDLIRASNYEEAQDLAARKAGMCVPCRRAGS